MFHLFSEDSLGENLQNFILVKFRDSDVMAVCFFSPETCRAQIVDPPLCVIQGPVNLNIFTVWR